MSGIKLILASTLLLLAASSVSVFGVCNQTSASLADRELWNTHGCWVDFFKWSPVAYNMYMPDAGWENRGWKDACNVNFEFPKHWNAAYLVTYGLNDNNDESFHGSQDYRETGEARGGKYHQWMSHAITDNTDYLGRFKPGFFYHQLITACLLYNADSPNGNPASRASDFMHEGRHAWEKKYGWSSGGSCGGHRCGPIGYCTLKNCDNFFFHGIGTYAFGGLWIVGIQQGLFHSPNQIQVEFLCDVADQSKDWVPNIVRLASKADADQRAVQSFINAPGYKCGDPRPW